MFQNTLCNISVLEKQVKTFTDVLAIGAFLAKTVTNFKSRDYVAAVTGANSVRKQSR